MNNTIDCMNNQRLENNSIGLSEQAEKDEENENLSALRAEELDILYKESSSAERISLPSGFSFDRNDWLVFLDVKGEDDNTVATKICSRLEVIARTRDINGENHGRLLQFVDPDGVKHSWAMPMSLLAGDCTAYRQELLSRGLLISPGKNARQLLTTYIQISLPATTVRCVTHTGWNHDCTAFVFHKETLGNVGKEPLILQSSVNLPTTQSPSGTLEEWQKIASLCLGNDRLSFVVSAAFAPPLLHLLGLENGGIHLRGGSSTGKTTCLHVGASVWGGEEYVQQWRSTVNGLEGVAAAHNDCILILDEMGQMDPAEIGKVAYMLANGTGKIRADKIGDARSRKQWRLLFLSTGEISLADHMSEGKCRSRAGQEIRVLDIVADGQKYGCFQELHDFENPKEFAEHLSNQCKSCHGVAGPEFIKCLLFNQKEVIKNAQSLKTALCTKYLPATASSQVQRAFNRFALIAIAGELASSFGITGWKEGTGISAAVNCFNDWLRGRGDMGPQEEKAIIAQVKLFFEHHGQSRFTSWFEQDQQREGKTLLRVGYRKPCEDGDEFFVFRESFKSDIAIGFDPEYVAQVCLKHGLLMPDSKGGSTRSERLPGAKKCSRVYRFTANVLVEGE